MRMAKGRRYTQKTVFYTKWNCLMQLLKRKPLTAQLLMALWCGNKYKSWWQDVFLLRIFGLTLTCVVAWQPLWSVQLHPHPSPTATCWGRRAPLPWVSPWPISATLVTVHRDWPLSRVRPQATGVLPHQSVLVSGHQALAGASQWFLTCPCLPSSPSWQTTLLSGFWLAPVYPPPPPPLGKPHFTVVFDLPLFTLLPPLANHIPQVFLTCPCLPPPHLGKPHFTGFLTCPCLPSWPPWQTTFQPSHPPHPPPHTHLPSLCLCSHCSVLFSVQHQKYWFQSPVKHGWGWVGGIKINRYCC